MPTLPTPGGDNNTWGTELNDWLTKGGLAVFEPGQGYGAAFDNVADDAAEIQAAIDAASEYAGGGGNGGYGAIVQLPAKRIKINTTLRLKDGVWLRGAGPGTDLRGTANPVIATPTSGTVPDNMMVSDLTMTPTGVGIKLDSTGLTGSTRLGWPRVIIENVTSADAGSHAFWVVNSQYIEARFINCVSLRAAGYGFYIASTDNFLIGCTAAESTLDGFKIEGGNNKLSCCKAYGNDGYGFNAGNGGRHMLAGCEAQDNVGAGFFLDANWNTIAGCLADTNGEAGVKLYGGNHVVDCASMTGGGGSGQTTKVGFLFPYQSGSGVSGCQVRGVSNCTIPVGGSTVGNEIKVYQTNGGGRQVVAYAATLTPNPYLAEMQEITLTGNITINAEGQNKHVGQRLTLELVQDGTGGRTTTFSSRYRTNWTPSTTANHRNIITFEYDGNFWQQIAATTGLTSGALTVADTFNRADGAIGTSSSGHVWTTSMASGGTWNVASNQAVTSGATNFQNNFAVLDAGVSDYTMQVTLVTEASGGNGLTWRYTDRNNCIALVGGQLSQWVSGGQTVLVGSALSWTSGDTIKVEASGSTHRIYKNGTLVWAGVIPVLLTGTKAGLLSQVNGNIFDNFTLT